MPILKVSELGPPLDGEYDADISNFTNRELHLIKVESGVRAGEIEGAFQAGDNDLVVAITLIVLQRAGKGDAAQYKDVVWDAPAGSISFDLTDIEKAEAQKDDALPPVSAPAELDGGSENRQPSGEPSNGAGGLPANDQKPTGMPGLDTGVLYAPATSATSPPPS